MAGAISSGIASGWLAEGLGIRVVSRSEKSGGLGNVGVLWGVLIHFFHATSVAFIGCGLVKELEVTGREGPNLMFP